MELGASFSHRHLKYLGLDPTEAIKEFKSLGLKWIRLGCYWDEIESEENKYSFVSLDPLIKYCEKNGIKVLLTLGMKAPRYPEYYLPDWLKEKIHLRRLSLINNNNGELLSPTLRFIRKTVEHFKKSSSIKVWQVENEPMDPSGEKWWRIDSEFLGKEIALVRKLDTERKILVNIWGNELTRRKIYKKAVSIGDIVGFDIYTRQPIWFFRLIKKYLGPLESQEKIVAIVKEIKNVGKTFWITELQAEPWEPDTLVFQGDNPPSFPPEQFEKNLNYVKELEPETIFLWGFEYWLWKKSKGDLRYWTEAKKVIKEYA